MEKGFVFVSTNYRLLPNVEMDTIIRDVAKSLGWVHKHIAEHGGDAKEVWSWDTLLVRNSLRTPTTGI